MNSWFVYMLKCADGSLYTGITTDVSRRVGEHNGCNIKADGKAGEKAHTRLRGKGAAYTASRRPVSLVYRERASNRSEASKREAEIKKLSRSQKLLLLNLPVDG